MAVLSDPQRQEAWAEMMRAFLPGTVISMTKTQFRSIVNAVDQVLSDNATALNSAIQAIDSNWNTLSQSTRADIFAFMVRKRYGAGV